LLGVQHEEKLMILNSLKKLNHQAVYLSIIVLGAFFSRLSTIFQPLVERHDFRQTQTAYQTLTMATGEGSLLRPKLPIFGSPWEVIFEFPLFQWIASYLFRWFGLGLDTANRLTSLLFFVLCCVALFYLAKLLISTHLAFASVILFGFSPLAIQWSRASLIEYCALFFAIVFSFLLLKMWESQKIHLLVLASVMGSLGGLVKVTTLVPHIIFVGIYILLKTRSLKELLENRRRLIFLSLPMLSSIIVARLWTMWSDHSKELNPATKWLTEKNLFEWNYGTVQQRKISANWSVILDRIDQLIIGRFSVVAILIVAILIPKSRVRLIALLAGIIVTISIFFNLYIVHDYYLVAISSLLVLAVGVTVDSILVNNGSLLYRSSAFLAIILIVLISLITQRSYWTLAYKNLPTPVSELKERSDPNQYAFTSYGGWNPVLLYYAERRGMMLDTRAASIESLRMLPDLDKYDFYYGAPDRPEIMQLRGWYLPLATQTTRIDDNLNAFAQWGLAVGNATNSNLSNTNQQVITCNGQETFSISDVPAGRTVSTETSGTNSLQFANGMQVIPVGTQIRVLGKINNIEHKSIACVGDGSVSFKW
jgi:hypothetical protein